ncbi:DUF4349 domain-containing protein [Pseudomonas sp. RIT-PI-AD]|uniref:DUF4349 domain-containing protein n=1 Tax=Pseudomonas sp. RIT-PI-AD TaxID=3035294 RepID=UPI0021D8054A|nr:DUF4349 domain-containing protein [Pseudomonas sp. RIT-PI-AD]
MATPSPGRLAAGFALLVALALAGCSEGDRQAPASGAAPLQGERGAPEAFLAYEHRVAIRLPEALIEPRLAATRDACVTNRFGPCALLSVEQHGGRYRAGSLSLRVVPEGVEGLVGLAAGEGVLESRSTRAQDLAQAVEDNQRQRERLERQRETLLGYQARRDLSVSDMLALARELADVETQLAGLEQTAAEQRRRLSTNLLTLDFSADAAADGRVQRIARAADGLLDNLADGAAQALGLLGYGIPFALLLFPLALLVRALWRRATRPRR